MHDSTSFLNWDYALFIQIKYEAAGGFVCSPAFTVPCPLQVGQTVGQNSSNPHNPNPRHIGLPVILNTIKDLLKRDRHP